MNDVLPQMTSGQSKSFRQEFQFIDSRGNTTWGDVQIAPVRDEDGKLDSLLITILDVTDRREIEAELIRQFSFLQALLDTIPNAIFYKGADTRFLGCNQAYERFFGINRHQFIGKRVLDLDYIPAEIRAAYQAEDEMVIAECGKVTREVQMQDANSRLADTLYSISGFRSPDGTPGGLIGIIVDISPLKEAKRTAEKAQAAAEMAAAAKADFLANMSHEIRTPMNAVIGMTHLALQTDLTSRQRNYLSKVDNAAKGLLGIINDILDLSKIEAGMMHFEQAPFSLDASLRHLGDVCSLKARERGLELLYDVAPDVPDHLIGDSLRLVQVLLNLVGNAIKFTEAGEVSVVVHRLASTDGRVELRFEIRDTGIGMSADQQAKLFSAFTQADTSTTRKYGGTGLGLSICKRIVDMQGGSISVTSRLGVGSCFSFHLSFGLAIGVEAGNQRVGLPEALRALVVDDSPGTCEVFGHMLTALGIPSHAVNGGAQALDELAAAARDEQPYGLLIVDWNMPGMDGVEVVRRISQSGAAEKPAIVMATAFDHEELLAALGSLKVGAILSKPATPSSLFDSIMLALHRDSALSLVPQPTPAELSRHFTGRRVLLVEDNEVNRELAYEMLTNVGLSVDTAENGQQALEALQREGCDLVLMDCQMPVMDGYAATVRIRDDLKMRDLPIVAMTANALASDRDRCLSVGMNDHIPKPIDVAILYATLAHWLKPRHDEQNLPPVTLVSDSLPETLEIDTSSALARMGGNRSMYDRLLVRFRENQGDVVDRLRVDREQGDQAAMILRAHTLRGLAGNIGAVTLARLAGELETSLRQGVPPGDQVVDQLLLKLAEALPAALAIPATSIEVSQPGTPHPDSESHANALSKLRFLLDNDDAAAVGCFEDISGWLDEQFAPPMVAQLARQIGQYEFEEASATLQQIAPSAGAR